VSLARGLERRLERLVDGLAARLFRGSLHPVELGTRLVREADLGVTETEAGPAVPNRYVVTVGSPPDDSTAVHELESELAAVVEETAAERGWRLEGPVEVAIRSGEGAAASGEIESAFGPGDLSMWATLIPDSSDSGRVLLRHNRAVLGRSATADGHIADDRASRRHALIWRQEGSIWLADLESSNGTIVNGVRITSTVELANRDHISFGGAGHRLESI